ncbi:dTDP-4-dehydrorhamnose 3,5-epimerase family protein, partial [Phaeobacter gallaeciensis]|uniref:dTDP-4-dehydrorhamnose 3,5-epimerase family protein n=1 Tax=Phaeobacter gallaeciensis TaxID=60890 RepID=UPI00237F3807
RSDMLPLDFRTVNHAAGRKSMGPDPSEEAVVVYHQTNHFDAASETGINFDSFGFQWPVQNIVISEKDAALPGSNEVL